MNNCLYCILGNQGIAGIYQHITELLTTFKSKSATYTRKYTDSKIIDIANCNTCKITLLAVECTIWIRYYYQTAKTTTLNESTNGCMEQPTDNVPNSDRLGDFHPTRPEELVQEF